MNNSQLNSSDVSFQRIALLNGSKTKRPPISLEELLEQAKEDSKRTEKGEAISQEYFNVPCPRCGKETKGNGQKKTIDRMCKWCGLRFSINNWIILLSEGVTPLAYHVNKLLDSILRFRMEDNHTEEEELLKSKFIPPVVENNLPEQQPCSPTHLPTHSPTHSPPHSPKEYVLQISEISDKYKDQNINSSNVVTEKTKRYFATDGLMKIINAARTDESIGIFLTYLQENILPCTKDYLDNKYISLLSSGENEKAEEIRGIYDFISDDLICPISENISLKEVPSSQVEENRPGYMRVGSTMLQRQKELDYLSRGIQVLTKEVEVIKEQKEELTRSIVFLSRLIHDHSLGSINIPSSTFNSAYTQNTFISPESGEEVSTPTTPTTPTKVLTPVKKSGS